VGWWKALTASTGGSVDASFVPACLLTVCAWRLGPLTLEDLWWRYVSLGGTAEPADVADYLQGLVSWPAREHNLLAQALNEGLWEVGLPSLAPVRSGRAPQQRSPGRGPG
jgi:hypothetical protein